MRRLIDYLPDEWERAMQEDALHFTKTSNPRGLGRGFGRECASYRATLDGHHVADLDNFGRGNWRVLWCDGRTKLVASLAEAKALVIQHMSR